MSALSFTTHPLARAGEMASQIEAFLCEYAYALDDGRIDEWSSFFSSDAIYQVTTQENDAAGYPLGIIYCEGVGMMNDRVKALKEANIFESHTYCHILTRPSVREEVPGIVSARSNFSIFRTMHDGRAEIFATGKYLDRIDVRAARPAFLERRVILDSRRIDVLLVYPL